MKFNKEWPIARGEAERKRFQTSKDGKLLTEGKEQAIEGEGQLLLTILVGNRAGP